MYSKSINIVYVFRGLLNLAQVTIYTLSDTSLPLPHTPSGVRVGVDFK